MGAVNSTCSGTRLCGSNERLPAGLRREAGGLCSAAAAPPYGQSGAFIVAKISGLAGRGEGREAPALAAALSLGTPWPGAQPRSLPTSSFCFRTRGGLVQK